MRDLGDIFFSPLSPGKQSAAVKITDNARNAAVRVAERHRALASSIQLLADDLHEHALAAAASNSP